MPKQLKGVPDLYVVYQDVTWWIEVKPIYVRWRDIMKPNQMEWFWKWRPVFNGPNFKFVLANTLDDMPALGMPDQYRAITVPDWHWQRMLKWHVENSNEPTK